MFGSIGMPELIIIFVIALIIFGPRKLPELGRSLGKSLVGVQAGVERAEEHARRGNPPRRAARQSRGRQGGVGAAAAADRRRRRSRPPRPRRPRRRVTGRSSPRRRRSPWPSCLFRVPSSRGLTVPLPKSPTTTTSRARRRADVVSGAPRRAPEAHHPLVHRDRASASSPRFCVHPTDLRFHPRADAQRRCRPASS